MSNKLKFALIAAGVGAGWLILATLVSALFGDFLRLGLGWTDEGSGTVGIIMWIGLVIGVPASALGVYSHVGEQEAAREALEKKEQKKIERGAV